MRHVQNLWAALAGHGDEEGHGSLAIAARRSGNAAEADQQLTLARSNWSGDIAALPTALMEAQANSSAFFTEAINVAARWGQRWLPRTRAAPASARASASFDSKRLPMASAALPMSVRS